jgi:hypothetical protein
MTLEQLFNMTKGIDQTVPKAEITLYLSKSNHDKLQEEVYKMKDPTLSSYKPQTVFQVRLDKVLFILRIV